MDVRLESLFPPPVRHPGVVLQQEFLVRYGIPQGELAKAIRVDPTNLCTVIHGRRRVRTELGRRLAMALRTSPEYWLLRQLAWDLEHAAPLPLIEPLPQLREHGHHGLRASSGLYLNHGTEERRPRRELSG